MSFFLKTIIYSNTTRYNIGLKLCKILYDERILTTLKSFPWKTISYSVCSSIQFLSNSCLIFFQSEDITLLSVESERNFIAINYILCNRIDEWSLQASDYILEYSSTKT